MEDDINVDELFGDPNPINIRIPATSVAKGYLERLSGLRAGSCVQRIAWSKNGCVASLSNGGQEIQVRCLFCRQNDGSWILSESVPVKGTTASFAHPLVHLSWNHSGTDFAAVDSYGRISIFVMNIAVKRYGLSRSSSLDQEDDMAALVGMFWLSQARMYLVLSAAEKQDTWSLQILPRNHVGPYLPPKFGLGLFCLTKAAVLRFIYQTPDNRWMDVSLELESISSSDEILTHSHISPQKEAAENSLLVATYNTAKVLNIYRVMMKWNTPNTKLPQAFSYPSIQARLVVSKDLSMFIPPAASDLETLGSSRSRYQYELTHLQIVPSSNEKGDPANPEGDSAILAVFSRATSSFEQQMPSCSIVRWEFKRLTDSLHPTFDEVASKKHNASNSKNQEPVTALFIDGVATLDKDIVALDQINFGTSVVFAHSDGSVTFHDSTTLKDLSSDPDPNKISVMPHGGFEFPLDTSSAHVAFSPNACMAASISPSGDVRLRKMEYILSSWDDSTVTNHQALAVTALALQFVRSSGCSSSCEDILALVHNNKDLLQEFQNEIYRFSQIELDFAFAHNHEKLFRNTNIQRCLSMQASLGAQSHLGRRNLTSNVAWITLSLRNAFMMFGFTINTKTAPQSGEYELNNPDVLEALFGNTKWHIDLTIFIMDELFELADKMKEEPDQACRFQLIRDSKSVALLLILASVPRTYMKTNCRCLRGLTNKLFDLCNSAPGNQIQAIVDFQALIETPPIKVSVFERFLAEIENIIRHAYQSGNFSPEDRRAAEKQMLVSCEIPPIMLPVTEKILSQSLDRIQNDPPGIDRAGIYFRDISWLGVSDDKATRQFQKTRVVDAHRKILLAKNAPLRRCVRCGAQVEDLPFHKGQPPWLMTIQRNCICGSMWMIDPAEQNAQ
ncbi:MAG: mediator complex subunit [Cirrosporium novae-zelandiae]|nr:MAG: mediator complex subunit [Cirrosporium novae-zelandiae]